MFQPLIDVVYRAATWVIEALFGAIEPMWSALVDVFSFMLEWIARFFMNVVTIIVELLLVIAEFAVSLLQDAPAAPDVPAYSFLEQANQYLAVSEALGLLGIWSAIFTGIAIYKGLKFISPVSA